MTCVPGGLYSHLWAQGHQLSPGLLVPGLCCVGTDLQLSCSQTCTLLQALSQTLTHRLSLLNLSQGYGPALRSMGSVWSWLLSLGLVLKGSFPFLVLVRFFPCPLFCSLPISYIYVCGCMNTSVFTYITSCTISLGWLGHYSCTLSSGIHGLNQLISLCLRPRCPELVLRSVFPTYDLIQEARWEPNWFCIQMVSSKKKYVPIHLS